MNGISSGSTATTILTKVQPFLSIRPHPPAEGPEYPTVFVGSTDGLAARNDPFQPNVARFHAALHAGG